MPVTLKCRKCRHELVKETSENHVVTSAHAEKLLSETEDKTCSSTDQDSLWFLEETATSWISELILKAEWTKGKLNCPNCDARVGSFDFVSRSKCACGSHILPAVRLVKSKVDSSSQGSNPLASLKT